MDEDFAREVEELRKQAQRVEEVMLQLPVLLERKERIRDLASDVVSIARNDYPVTRGDKAAISALELLVKQMEKVIDMIGDLPLEAQQALAEAYGSAPWQNFSFGDHAYKADARHAKIAKERLEAKPVKRRGGRPESRAAFEVSCHALRAYETLTGKRAGITTSATETGHPRSGEFLNFLTQIFKACDVSASPSSQAKKALADRASSSMPDYYPALLAHSIRQALEDYVPPDGIKQKTPNKTPD